MTPAGASALHQPPPGPGWHGDRAMPARTGYLVIALAFAIAAAFPTVPTPLYGLYERQDDFATFAVTVIYAAFAAGTIASLFLVGHLSDLRGRRRMLLLGLAAEVVACAVFLLFDELPGLVVARFVSGVGTGLLTATATAYLGELRGAFRGDRDASSVATLANLGGLALGPLIGGAFAQFLPDPLELPFLLFLVLLLAAMVGVAAVPETVVRPERMPPYRPQRIAVPPGSRGTYAAAAAAAFAAYAVFGLYSSLVTTVLTDVLDEPSRLLAGAISSSVFVAAALAQFATVRLASRVQVWLAVGATLTGLGLLVAGVLASDLALFVASAVVVGAGVGALFRTALRVAASLAEPERRGEALAGVYLVAYLGVAGPVLALGAALQVEPLRPLVAVFAVAAAAVVVVAAPALARHRGG